MKRTLLALTALGALTAALTLSAAASNPTSATLEIHHKVKGCHVWSLNGGAFGVSQTAKLKPGGSVLITDNDLMPHKLIKLSGGAVAMKLVAPGNASVGALKPPYAAGEMPHMSAVLKVTFPKAGVYTFKTVSGEDYTPNVKTVGEDNVLKLKVAVG